VSKKGTPCYKSTVEQIAQSPRAKRVLRKAKKKVSRKIRRGRKSGDPLNSISRKIDEFDRSIRRAEEELEKLRDERSKFLESLRSLSEDRKLDSL